MNGKLDKQMNNCYGQLDICYKKSHDYDLMDFNGIQLSDKILLKTKHNKFTPIISMEIITIVEPPLKKLDFPVW